VDSLDLGHLGFKKVLVKPLDVRRTRRGIC
jgi:hypothetical protein